MTAYDVHVSRYHVRLVLDMPGLSQITLTHPDTAVLRFDTALGCDPCGAEFLAAEVARMGAAVIAVVTLPG